MSTVLASTTTLPTVTYDRENSKIKLTVIVSPPLPGSNDLTIVASPCTIPHGTWKVLWDLVPEGVSAQFMGIDLVEDPLKSGQVRVTSIEVTSLQIRAVIDNKGVTDVNKFRYTIFAAPQASLLAAPDASPHITRHDPTIAVTSEPIDG